MFGTGINRAFQRCLLRLCERSGLPRILISGEDEKAQRMKNALYDSGQSANFFDLLTV